MRTYFRMLPDFFERKALGTESRPAYPPAAIAALVGVLCLAEQQPQRGRFKSRRLLQVLLEENGGKAYGKHVPYLIKNGDLAELPDGSLYVDGWDELQEGDAKSTDRVRRFRDRKRGGVTMGETVRNAFHETVSNNGTRNMSPPVGDRGEEEEVEGEGSGGGVSLFGERYSMLAMAYGERDVDARISAEFEQIAEDWPDPVDIAAAIRECQRANLRPYPSHVRKFLPALVAKPEPLPERIFGDYPTETPV